MPKLSPKDITNSFTQQGFYLRPDGLQILKIFLKGKSKSAGKSILSDIIRGVNTVIENNAELSDDQFINSNIIEHALKLLPKQSSGRMEEESFSQVKREHGVKKENGVVVKREKVEKGTRIINDSTNGNPESYVEVKINNSLILVSNFGEKPKVSFENVKRELMIIPPHLDIYSGPKQMDLDYPVNLDVQKYHRMRYLLLKTGKYAFEHDSRDKNHKKILTEIGSLQGRQGKFTIFGLIYKNINK